MNYTFLAMIGWPEMVAILAVALLLFGARKLPELARGLGQGIKEFKKATKEVTDDLQHAVEDESRYTPKTPARPETEQTIPQSQNPSKS